jgi:hypothetical protein
MIASYQDEHYSLPIKRSANGKTSTEEIFLTHLTAIIDSGAIH